MRRNKPALFTKCLIWEFLHKFILTTKSRKEDFIEGLESDAYDYIVKPFDSVELQVRVRAATCVVKLQEDLWNALRQTEIKAKDLSVNHRHRLRDSWTNGIVSISVEFVTIKFDLFHLFI